MFMSLLTNCNLWLLTFMTGYIHDIHHGMNLPLTKMAFCERWQIWKICHHFSSPCCSTYPLMGMWRRACVCVQWCVYGRERQLVCRKCTASQFGSSLGGGGWEVTCFRRLSFSVRSQTLTIMLGSTQHAYVSLKIWPWPLTFMEKHRK